jgi:hypothetical protein
VVAEQVLGYIKAMLDLGPDDRLKALIFSASCPDPLSCGAGRWPLAFTTCKVALVSAFLQRFSTTG